MKHTHAFRFYKHAVTIIMAGIIIQFMASDGFCDQIRDDEYKKYYGIEDGRSTDLCGLYKVLKTADKFMATQNAINHTNWEVVGLDHRACLQGCLVPLKAKWMPNKWAQKDYGFPSPGVMVYCTKASTKHSSSKKDYWDVILNVTPPFGSFESFFYIEKAAVALLKRTHSKWTVYFPSTDVFVGKCLVPLEATMIKRKSGISTVNVTCKKPLQTFFFKGDSWTLPVPLQEN